MDARARRRARRLDAGAELIYLDRENQGGCFLAWLMSRVMTEYLVLQAQQGRRFFATGGPPKCKAHRRVEAGCRPAQQLQALGRAARCRRTNSQK
jgi:hypothetical protein